MIWFLLIATILVSVFFLFAPLWTDKEDRVSRTGLFGLMALSFTAIAGLYFFKGSPELTGKHADSLKAQYYYSEGLLSQSVAAYKDLMALYPDDEKIKGEFEAVLRDLSQISKEDLQIIQTVAELKLRLKETGSTDPKEWRLLANSQMKLGQHDEALASYERLTQIAPGNETYETEYARAINFIETQKRAGDMAPEDRQAMIENMVSGLAARLRSSGGTTEEWARLIRSRRQLGQDALLAEDLEFLKKQFENQPEIIKELLGESEERARDFGTPKWKQFYQSLLDWAAWSGVTMNFPGPHFPLRSVHAMRFCCLLEDDQKALKKFAKAGFDAYYEHQVNLDDPDELVRLANSIGLDGDAMRRQSQQQSCKDHLRKNTDEAIARGAFGSPSIFVPFGEGEKLYFGNDQLPLVRWAIEQGRKTNAV